MEYSNIKKSLLLTLISMTVACNSRSISETNVEKRAYSQQLNPVKVLVLRKSTFKKELISNGKLVALQKSELKFIVNETIEYIGVKNGEKVLKGTILSRLNQFEFQQKLDQVQTRIQKTKLDLQDILIGQGYSKVTDSANIPPHIYEMAAIRSGYTDALQELKTAEYNLESSVLKAPFTGKAANIKQKTYEQANTGEPFCTLIEDSEFEVEFSVIEDELWDIRMNDKVQIMPFSDSGIYRGHISEINPVVDENGLIKVKAKVLNSGKLIEGMNVKVMAEKEIPGQLVVPKSAVVLRQNQEVLFKCIKDSIAFWIYVKTMAENSTSYTVIADPEKGGSLVPGDTIIVSGNLNLAHESKVIIQ